MEREPFTQMESLVRLHRGATALVQRAVIAHRQQHLRGVTALELCIQIGLQQLHLRGGMGHAPSIQMEPCAPKALGEMVCEQLVVKFREVDFRLIELFNYAGNEGNPLTRLIQIYFGGSFSTRSSGASLPNKPFRYTPSTIIISACFNS